MPVYRRIKNGKLSQVFTMDITFGKQRMRASTGKTTKEEAEAFEAEFMRQLEAKVAEERKAGRYADVPESKPVVKKLYLRAAAARAYDEHWKNNRAGDRPMAQINAIADVVGDIALEDINTTFLADLKNRLSVGREPSTVNRYLAALTKLLSIAAQEWGAIPAVPKVKKYSEKGRGRTFTFRLEHRDIVLTFFKEKGDDDMADLTELLLNTGMRLTEALSITYRKHIDLKNKFIRLTPDIVKGVNVRDIPLTARAMQILEGRKERVRPFGMTRDAAEGRWTWMSHSTGLKNVNKEAVIHCLRHTFASDLLAQGVDIYTISKLLGHCSVTVTERYSHMDHGKLRSAIEVLDGGTLH